MNTISTSKSREIDPIQMIDLFVDLTFAQNEIGIVQFKMIANQVGFPKDMVEKLISLGKEEYAKMTDLLVHNSKK